MQVSDEEKSEGQLKTKASIALVADVREWAFSNISEQIHKHLGDKYDFQILYLGDYERRHDQLFKDLFCQSFDLVHFFWRGAIYDLYVYLKYLYDLEHDEFNEHLDGFVKTPITFSIYDHCLLSGEELTAREVVFSHVAAGYTVSSEKLRHVYSAIEGFSPPLMVIEDGVDLDLFYPKNLERLEETDREIFVGWVGNSTWWNQDGIDHKGFVTLIRPAVLDLRKEGLPVILRYLDRNDRFVPLNEMVDYYNSIDIYVCASDIEGTPNPVLESMACGVPVVSTDVGIVPQVFGPKQSEFMVEERTVEALQEKIRVLATSADSRKALSEENLQQIKGWTRRLESEKWDRFFQQVLETPNKDNGDDAEPTFDLATNAVLKSSLFSVPIETGRSRGIQFKPDVFVRRLLTQTRQLTRRILKRK